MFLSANEIRSEVDSGRLAIEPFDPNFLKPASYILRFDDKWRRWIPSENAIDLWSANAAAGNISSAQLANQIVLQPGEFLLGATEEKIRLPDNLVGILSGLSHLARFGVSVHTNAFLISPHFGGEIPTALTLELYSYNPTPIVIHAGMPACHLVLAPLSSGEFAEMRLGRSIYEGQEAPSAPKLYEEFRDYVRLLEDN